MTQLPISLGPDSALARANRPRGDVLPVSCPPRGLSRVQAAAYVGISPTKFDALVRDGRMPKPFWIDARAIWDRLKLDAAFTDLSDQDDHDSAWNFVA